MTTTIEIREVRENLYVVPAIDGRRRAGYALHGLLWDSGIREAVLVKVNGERRAVVVDILGWEVK